MAQSSLLATAPELLVLATAGHAAIKARSGASNYAPQSLTHPVMAGASTARRHATALVTGNAMALGNAFVVEARRKMNQNNEKNVSKNIPTPTPTGGQEFEEAILGPCPHDHGGHKILTTCGAGRVRVAAIEWMGQSAGEIVPGAYYIGGGIWVIQSGQDKHFSKENIFCHACAAATPTPEAGR